MYPLGRNFRRCQIKFRDFARISEKITKYQTSLDIVKCEALLKSLYNTCTSEKDNHVMPVKSSCLIHLQQLLLVAAFNLLVNVEEEKNGEELEQEPLQMETTHNRFTIGYAIQNLEYILKHEAYGDLIEKLEPMLKTSYLDDDEERRLLDLQNETVNRILFKLHYLANKNNVPTK